MVHGGRIAFVGHGGFPDSDPPPLIFVSYSHVDKPLVERLVTHLKVLETNGLARIFCDLEIRGGQRWRDEIEKAIDEAALAVTLVSADSLNSAFVNSHEIPRILEREKKGLRVVPVLLRPCSWQVCEWLADRQILMEDGERALSVGSPEEVEAHFAALALQILELLQELPQPEPPTTTTADNATAQASDAVREAKVLKASERFQRRDLALATARVTLEHAIATAGAIYNYYRAWLAPIGITDDKDAWESVHAQVVRLCIDLSLSMEAGERVTTYERGVSILITGDQARVVHDQRVRRIERTDHDDAPNEPSFPVGFVVRQALPPDEPRALLDPYLSRLGLPYVWPDCIVSLTPVRTPPAPPSGRSSVDFSDGGGDIFFGSGATAEIGGTGPWPKLVNVPIHPGPVNALADTVFAIDQGSTIGSVKRMKQTWTGDRSNNAEKNGDMLPV